MQLHGTTPPEWRNSNLHAHDNTLDSEPHAAIQYVTSVLHCLHALEGAVPACQALVS